MLFKPMKGNSTRISTDATPFHEGWAYFTIDDGKFYIDAIDDNSVERRICINPDVTFVKTFSASAWSDGKITIPASEHKLPILNGCVGSSIFALVDGEYTNQAFAAIDTDVSVDVNKNVILSTPGTGYAGRVVLYS